MLDIMFLVCTYNVLVSVCNHITLFWYGTDDCEAQHQPRQLIIQTVHQVVRLLHSLQLHIRADSRMSHE